MTSANKKQARVWNRWITYLRNVNRATDPHLESLNSSEYLKRLKPIIFSSFAQAL
jgi:hypothetical protein